MQVNTGTIKKYKEIRSSNIKIVILVRPSKGNLQTHIL